MSDRSGIEWTEATWNPVTGCTKVSPGCDHCYAETLAERFRGTPGHYFEHGFDVQLRPAKLDLPLRWTRPRRIFVNSMSDLFHDAVPDGYIARVWATMAAARQHTFQVLTKRHGRLRSLLSSPRFQDLMAEAWFDLPSRPGSMIEWPLPNVWLGVSTENQQWADIRIPALLGTPAAVRWISAEPLLGSIDLSRWLHYRPIGKNLTDRPLPPSAARACGLSSLDWLVVGGESGRGARPMHPDWAESLRDQCDAAGIAFLFKQWGEWAPDGDNESVANGRRLRYDRLYLRPDGSRAVFGDGGGPGQCMDRVGKKTAGRELDGRLHDSYPT